MTRTRSPRRGGFTLVELLVAMALAIVLMALVVGVAGSDAFGSYKVVRSGDRVSGWLLIAKSRAIRDGQPRGVRFFRNATPGPYLNQFTEAQYIEVPDAWVPNPLQEANPTGPRIVFSYRVDTPSMPSVPPQVIEKRIFYVASSYTDFDTRVKANDVLTLPELGGAYRFTIIDNAATISIGGAAPVAARELKLGSMAEQLQSYPNLGAAHYGTTAGASATLTTYKFAFGGAARPLFGEPSLLIPDGTAILSDNSRTLGVTTTGTFDVVFRPDGQVMVADSTGTLTRPSNIVVLWIQDVDKPTGEQALVTVYPTGQIATHPAGPPGNLHQYVKDGLYTGGL